MSIADVLTQVAAATPTPTPTPSPDPTTAANVALSNYYLAVLLLAAAVAVIIVALAFAFRYHNRLLDVISIAVKNGQPATTTNDDALIQSAEPAIAGPGEGAPSAELAFILQRVDASLPVSWAAEHGTPASGSGVNFVTTFEKAGSYTVKATYTENNETKTLSKKVVIGAAVPAPAASAIALPFVIKNWGRLVIVIFGVGVISALMSTKVLDAAAGIGILGTLLGVGAVAATSGSGGDKPAPPED